LKIRKDELVKALTLAGKLASKLSVSTNLVKIDGSAQTFRATDLTTYIEIPIPIESQGRSRLASDSLPNPFALDGLSEDQLKQIASLDGVDLPAGMSDPDLIEAMIWKNWTLVAEAEQDSSEVVEEVLCIDGGELKKMVDLSDDVLLDLGVVVGDSDNLFASEYLSLGGFQYIAISSPSDFPEWPTLDITNSTATVSPEALRAVATATSREGVMNNIRFDAEQKAVVATDGHRLHVADANIKGESWQFPVGALKPLLSMTSSDIDFVLALGSNQEPYAVANINGIKFAVAVSQGEFPPWTEIMPTDYQHEITMKKSDVTRVIEQASLMVRKYSGLELTFNSNIAVKASNLDKGTFQQANIPINGNVDPSLTTGMSPRNFLDAVRPMNDIIEVKLNDKTQPIYFKAENFSALIMPLRS
jgi:DNA polymerase III sliding clamp (beta) subunit (PCNA family)